MTVPGDERSRTHPGHGYSESTEYFVRYISFTNKGEWEAYINELENPTYVYGKKKYVAMFVRRASIKKEVRVDVEV